MKEFWFSLSQHKKIHKGKNSVSSLIVTVVLKITCNKPNPHSSQTFYYILDVLMQNNSSLNTFYTFLRQECFDTFVLFKLSKFKPLWKNKSSFIECRQRSDHNWRFVQIWLTSWKRFSSSCSFDQRRLLFLESSTCVHTAEPLLHFI